MASLPLGMEKWRDMKRILILPLALLYVLAVMVISSHMHPDFKFHGKCLLCELSKSISTADTVSLFTLVDHPITVPAPEHSDHILVIHHYAGVIYCLARAPPGHTAHA